MEKILRNDSMIRNGGLTDNLLPCGERAWALVRSETWLSEVPRCKAHFAQTFVNLIGHTAEVKMLDTDRTRFTCSALRAEPPKKPDCPYCGNDELQSGYGLAAGPIGSYTFCTRCDELVSFSPDLEGMSEDHIKRIMRSQREFEAKTMAARAKRDRSSLF